MAKGMTRARWVTVATLAVVLAIGVGADLALSAGSDPADVAVAQRQAAIDQHYKDLQAQGLISPAPRPANPESAGPITQPAAAWTTGLTKNPDAPGGNLRPTTSWGFVTDSTNIQVYAGASSSTGSSIILVVREDRATYETSTQEIAVPRAEGPLTIVGESEGLLRLTAPDGSAFTFNVATGAVQGS